MVRCELCSVAAADRCVFTVVVVESRTADADDKVELLVLPDATADAEVV